MSGRFFLTSLVSERILMTTKAVASVLTALTLAVPAAAEVLTLGSYLAEVESRHSGAAAARDSEQGAAAYGDEARLLFAPNLFVEAESTRDSSPRMLPAIEGERSEYRFARAGLAQETPIGLTGRLYSALARTDLIGASPAFLPKPSFYTAGPAVELGLDLWRNLGGRESRAILASGRERSLAAAHAARFELKGILAAAESAYWTLAAARQSLAIARESQARAERLRSWTEDRVGRSLADKSDLLGAEAAVRLRELEAREAEEAVRAAARAFGAFREGPAGEERELETLIDDGALPRRAATPDDLAAAEHGGLADAAGSRAAAERSRPKLELYGAGSLNGRREGASQAVSDGFGTGGTRWTLGVRFAAPLDFSRVRGARRGRLAEERSAESLRRRAAFESADGWRALEERLEDARRKAEFTRSIEEAQRRRAAEERKRHEQGRTTAFFAVQAEQDWAAARRALVGAHLAVRLALAQMTPFSEK